MLIGRIEHARDMGFNHNPALYEGVILVSGDGMVNQFVNGLYMRPDACYAISYTHILYRCSYVRGVLYCVYPSVIFLQAHRMRLQAVQESSLQRQLVIV